MKQQARQSLFRMPPALRAPTLLGLCLAALAATAAAGAQAEGVASLLARLSHVPGVSAKFREEKRIQLLSMPLISEGSVYFTKPPALLRRVDTPEPSRMLLTQGQLKVWDASGQRSFELSANPALRSLAESFLYVLAGDYKALDRLYVMRFSGSAEASWKLQLVPKDKALSRLIRDIKLEGDGLRVTTLQLTEASGDVSTTRFTEVQTNRTFSSTEKSKLFEITHPP